MHKFLKKFPVFLSEIGGETVFYSNCTILSKKYDFSHLNKKVYVMGRVGGAMSEFPKAPIANLAMIEELYARFLQDPSSVDPSWRYFLKVSSLVLIFTGKKRAFPERGSGSSHL